MRGYQSRTGVAVPKGSFKGDVQCLLIIGYFKPIMVYFGVEWPVILGYLALQEWVSAKELTLNRKP